MAAQIYWDDSAGQFRAKGWAFSGSASFGLGCDIVCLAMKAVQNT